MKNVSYFITHSIVTLLLCHRLEAQFSYHVPSENEECKFEKLHTFQPSNFVTYEAGKSEYYDEKRQAFQCAGIFVLRHTIYPKGLMRPTYYDEPSLVYIEQGKGFAGLAFPGCDATGIGTGKQSISQKIVNVSQQGQAADITTLSRAGYSAQDILAVPAGVSFWMFNDNDNHVVAIQVFAGSNSANQLEATLMDSLLSRRTGTYQQVTGQSGYNVLSGFDTGLLAESQGVNLDLARMLQNENDPRGLIVDVQTGIEGIASLTSQDQYPQQKEGDVHTHHNHLDKFCPKEFIAHISCNFPWQTSTAILNVNSRNLPILNLLQLSAEIGVLQQVSRKPNF